MILHYVNEARQQRGLRYLRPSLALALSARWMAHYLSDRPMAHAANIHVDHQWVWAGEVLARGQSTAKQTVADWMDSKPHRTILLNPKARRLGAAHDRSSNTWVAHAGRLGRRQATR